MVEYGRVGLSLHCAWVSREKLVCLFQNHCFAAKVFSGSLKFAESLGGGSQTEGEGPLNKGGGSSGAQPSRDPDGSAVLDVRGGGRQGGTAQGIFRQGTPRITWTLASV